MATEIPPPLALITARDTDTLLALDRSPLTVPQLLKLSESFAYPFTSPRKTRQRLQDLDEAGLVRRFRFLTDDAGVANYYTLSPSGYQHLYGDEGSLPSKGTFGPVAIGRLKHTQALADFITHTVLAAHRRELPLADFYRENTLRLEAGSDHLYPDCAFSVLNFEGEKFSFFVELDNSTERVRSRKTIDSWERKVRFYEAYRDREQSPFRVLVIATGTEERIQHILKTAAELTTKPQRTLIYAATLKNYLACPEPLTSKCFRNHRGQEIALIPPARTQAAATMGVTTTVVISNGALANVGVV